MSHEARQGPFRKYLEAHSQTFSTPDRRVAFLTGALVNVLLHVQRKTSGASPFFHRLRGVKLTKEQLKRLLPEVQHRLRQYGVSGYVSKLLELLCHEWVDAEPNWSIGDDEATFFFVLGVNLQYSIGRPSASSNEREPGGGK